MSNATWVSVCLAALLGGCFDSDAELARCSGNGGGAYDPAEQNLRDPVTGVCNSMTGTAVEECDDGVGGGPAPGAFPDWGSCSSICDSLAETDCLAADGCRAVYVAEASSSQGGQRTFTACWATAQSGPLRGGVCEGRDALECSRYDDCSAVHDNAAGQAGSFRSCVSETICDPGYDQPVPLLRNPETGTCDFGGAGNVDPCASGIAPAPVADWGECGSFCEALAEGECKLADGCRAIYADTCAPWLDCPVTVDFVACWPIAPSGPSAPGGCVGLGSYECSLHNDCSAEHAQDWTGCSMTTPGCQPVVAGFLACSDEVDK